MNRIRTGIAAVLGLGLALALLVAPAMPAQASTGSGTINVKPGQLITAKFSGTKLDKNRTVTLSSSADGVTWTTVSGQTKKMSAKGAVTFSVVASDGKHYRATANTFKYKVKKKSYTAPAVTTLSRTAEQPTWAEEFSDLAIWKHRTDVGYQAQGRHCSAPIEANATASGGVARLKVTEVKSGRTSIIAQAKEYQKAEAGSAYKSAEAKLAKANAMKNKTKAEKKKRTAAIKKANDALKKLAPGCPSGVYNNAMITSNGNFSISKGTVVAQVKFAVGQGSHGGIWLQDGATRQEIDIIESYGYGQGVTSLVHRASNGKLVQDPKDPKKAYVGVKAAANKKWWSAWHTVAVTFDSNKVTFYLDGVKTNELKGMTGDYSLIVSQLSSDWETSRWKKPAVRSGSGVKKSSVKKTSLPTMQVNWIRAWQG